MSFIMLFDAMLMSVRYAPRKEARTSEQEARVPPLICHFCHAGDARLMPYFMIEPPPLAVDYHYRLCDMRGAASVTRCATQQFHAPMREIATLALFEHVLSFCRRYAEERTKIGLRLPAFDLIFLFDALLFSCRKESECCYAARHLMPQCAMPRR